MGLGTAGGIIGGSIGGPAGATIGTVLGSIAGGIFGGSSGPKQPSFQDQVDVQKQFAKNGIQWRVEDAKKAGIHPLYALGSGVTPFSPVTVGGADYEPSGWERVNEMGQNLGSALHRMGTKEERALATVTAAQAVERGQLENELLKSQIAQIRASINPAPSLNNKGQIIPGQADAGTVIIPKEIISSAGDTEQGLSPFWSTLRLGNDRVRVPGKGWADANLDDGPANWYVQLSRTIPDMIKADLNTAGRKWGRSKYNPFRK